MSRGAQMVAQMAGPPCERCGLRGPHVCVSLDPVACGTSERVYPQSIDPAASFRPRQDDRETCKAAALRIGMDDDKLGKILAASGLKRDGGRWRLKPELVDQVVARWRSQQVKGTA